MIIINRAKNKVINLSAATDVFKGADGYTIKVNFSNGSGTQIERYESISAADVALEMLCDAIGKVEKYIMPTYEQVNARVVQTGSDRQQHKQIDGKKQKSHGGS